VPLRLSRSRTRNRPSWPVSRQCFRETEGSTIAIPFEASRPIVISPSDKGIVESFRGPESTRSLGRTLATSRSSYHSLGRNPHPAPDCSNIRKDSPLSDRIALVFGTPGRATRAMVRVLQQRLCLEPVGAILNFVEKPTPTGIPPAQ
jgi:hypothetical protein